MSLVPKSKMILNNGNYDFNLSIITFYSKSQRHKQQTFCQRLFISCVMVNLAKGSFGM